MGAVADRTRPRLSPFDDPVFVRFETTLYVEAVKVPRAVTEVGGLLIILRGNQERLVALEAQVVHLLAETLRKPLYIVGRDQELLLAGGMRQVAIGAVAIG